MTEERTTDNDRLTITLKYGGDYAAPWAVIRGDTAEQTKQAIIDLLGGLKNDDVSKDWDLATLVASASIILQDRYNQAAKKLRGQHRIQRKHHRHQQNQQCNKQGTASRPSKTVQEDHHQQQ